jgi:hypothetical protein
MTSETFFTETPLCPSSDIDETLFRPLPDNSYTHPPPILPATPIKYEGYRGRYLAPPTLDTQTLPQRLDEGQKITFNLGEGNVQPGMFFSEEERISKLEKEIGEAQAFKATMFNELEVRQRQWTEFDEVKQRFEELFSAMRGFENRLAKIEVKMEEEREKSKASERIEKKPRERGKSKASGRIEKKPKEKPKKTKRKFLYVDLTQTQREFLYVDFTQ